MYFFKKISVVPEEIYQKLQTWSTTKQIAFAAIMASFSAILQSTGEYLPVIGLMISPFATFPILISMIVSFRFGFISFLSAIFILFLIEPSEFFIYPFTTGLLGVSLGWSMRKFNRLYSIMFINGCVLFSGICVPLYVMQFPLLGPVGASGSSFPLLLIIFMFSVVYSWIWAEFGLYFLRKIKGML